MDVLIDAIEAMFRLLYLKVGKVLYGTEFEQNRKLLPRFKKVIVATVTLLISMSAVFAIWCLIALALQKI